MSLNIRDSSSRVFDITILGAGPTGLFAAFYAGMRGASCKIIDSMPAPGGRLTAVYPEKYIYDVAGFPAVKSSELINNLMTQIAPYNTELCLGEAAVSLTHNAQDSVWELISDQGNLHRTKTLIIAAGVGSYTPRKHTAPGALLFEEKGIHYSVIKKSAFTGRKVLVAGGGDSALDWANELSSVAASVTLIHRSKSFRAHEDSLQKLKKTGARILTGMEIIEFRGNDCLREVVLTPVLEDTAESTEKEVFIESVDDALIMFGFHSSLGKIREWGLELTGNGITVNSRMETNLPGVFAAGDIAKYEGKLDLIVTGFSEAATAVAFAKVFLNPREKAQPIHSTTLADIRKRKSKDLS